MRLVHRQELIWRGSLLTETQLKDILCNPGITKTDQSLITLAVGVDRPKKNKAIRTLAMNAGAKALSKANISAYLAKAKGFAISTPKAGN
jgi:hypothetical protein